MKFVYLQDRIHILLRAYIANRSEKSSGIMSSYFQLEFLHRPHKRGYPEHVSLCGIYYNVGATQFRDPVFLPIGKHRLSLPEKPVVSSHELICLFKPGGDPDTEPFPGAQFS